MKQILKYELKQSSDNKFEPVPIPINSKVLCVGMLNNKPYVWVENRISELGIVQDMTFEYFLTEQKISDENNFIRKKYVGTLFICDIAYHVYHKE